MIKRKSSNLDQQEPLLKKQKINDTDHKVSISEQEAENQLNNREEEIKKWREEGKMEGLAYGVLALFSQDAIKKPSEKIIGKYLNLPDDYEGLSLLEATVDLYNDNIPKVIELIIEYMRGNRSILVANIIKDDYLKYNYLEDIPENLNVSEENIQKIMEIEDPSVEEINTILLDEDEGN